MGAAVLLAAALPVELLPDWKFVVLPVAGKTVARGRTEVRVPLPLVLLEITLLRAVIAGRGIILVVVLVVVSVVVVSVVVVSVVVVSVVVISVVVSVVITTHEPGGSSRSWQRGMQQRFGKVYHDTDPWVKVPGPRGTEKHHDLQEPTTSSSHCPRGQQDLQEHPVAAHGHHRGSGQCHLGGWHWLCCPALQTPPHSGVAPPCQGLGNNPHSPDETPFLQVAAQSHPRPPGPAWPGCWPAQAVPGRFPSGCRRHWRRAQGLAGSPGHTFIPACQPRAQAAPAGAGTA